MLEIRNLVYRIGPRVLFDNASLTLERGQKVGLAGINGSGKSTLFALILGEISKDEGEITLARNTKIAYMEQEISNLSSPLLDFVLSADKRLNELLAKAESLTHLEHAEHLNELNDIHDELILIEAHSAPARASELLHGLGFSEQDLKKPLSEFSGGWQMRAKLAKTLFTPADLLLLDEPTNHLDLETSLWLEKFLADCPTSLFIISHDRNILNSACTHIAHIEEKRILKYSGNYDTFERTRAEKRALTEKENEKLLRAKAHIQKFIDRFRYKATKAKQAQSRIKMLEKMGNTTELSKDFSLHFSFPKPSNELASPVVKLEQVSIGYNERPILKNLSLRIDADSRIALLGANGNGKSTLAKLIASELKKMSGEMEMNRKLNVAYFSQSLEGDLKPDLSALAHMRKVLPDKNDVALRAHLANFGLSVQIAENRVENLSGGEKARLTLALITATAPEMLILDEPTNHLDIASRESLMNALNDYEGAVILITHDLYLIEYVADELWLVSNGTAKPYDGSIEDYKNLLLKKDKKVNKAAKPEKKETAAKKANPVVVKKKLADLEKLITEYTNRRGELESILSASFTLEAAQELAELNRKIEDFEQEWLSLNASLDS